MEPGIESRQLGRACTDAGDQQFYKKCCKHIYAELTIWQGMGVAMRPCTKYACWDRMLGVLPADPEQVDSREDTSGQRECLARTAANECILVPK